MSVSVINGGDLLASLLAGGGGQRPNNSNRNEQCGIPEAQADRLKEFWALYSVKAEVEARFQPGDLIMADPAMSDWFPHTYPVKGVPAVVISTDKNSIPAEPVESSAPTNYVRDMIVGVNFMMDEGSSRGKVQAIGFFATCSRFWVAYEAPAPLATSEGLN